MIMMMRLFIALDIEAAVLERLTALQQKLRQATGLGGREVKWVPADQMHLTLKFLGPVKPDDVPRVCAMAQETAGRIAPFELTCKGVSVFGNPARVVWAGIDASEVLHKLQCELDERFTQAGFAAENRGYTAHLTLCRVKSATAGFALAAAVEPFAKEAFGTTGVDSLAVYESRLSADGPEYGVVSRSLLR